jgi:AraC-like DNA-binding protein
MLLAVRSYCPRCEALQVSALSGRSKTERGTISVYFVVEAVRVVEARGVPIEPLLEQAGIPPKFLREPLARVSPAQFSALWTGITRQLDDEFFGLDSHPMREGSYALMCHAALSSANLHQALKRILRFMRLVLDDLDPALEVRGGQVYVRLRDTRPEPPLLAHATLFVLVFGLACWLIDRRIPLAEGSFQSPSPGEAVVEYQSLFCEHLEFAQPESWLAFPESYLQQPVVQSVKTLRDFFREAPANFLLKYRNPRSTVTMIRRRLRGQAPADWPLFERLCEELHCAQATLRRRLRLEGQTYQSVKDDLRRDMALDQLLHGDRSTPEVASLLGFADPSAFYRAFRKWTGGLPSDYRAGSVRGRTR